MTALLWLWHLDAERCGQPLYPGPQLQDGRWSGRSRASRRDATLIS